MRKFEITQIGVIRTPFKTKGEAPIQAYMEPDAAGEVQVFDDYAPGLRDVEGFSHRLLLYRFHPAEKGGLIVPPFLDDAVRGVFATRHPRRPNHIGIPVVRLFRRRGNVLEVAGVDMLDGTPLLDIKPYVPPFDKQAGPVRVGWLEGKA